MSNNSSDLIGKRFGRLTIVDFTHAQKPRRGWLWVCECDCGNIRTLIPGDVKRGKVRSCGCLHDEVCRERATKFEHSVLEHKRLYSIYNWMKRRCYGENEPRYKDYGGRGIKVCDEWLNEEHGFDSFVSWALSNDYSDELTIDRIDVDGDYSPNNCRWFTAAEQNINKRDTLTVEYEGEQIPLKKLCESLGIPYDCTHNRIYNLGWSVEKAITTPSQRETSLAKKCREHGIKYDTVLARMYRYGWDEEKALTTPLRNQRKTEK